MAENPLKFPEGREALSGWYRWTFQVLRWSLSIESTRRNNDFVDEREIKITAVPQSAGLSKKFEHIAFRLVENTRDDPRDSEGSPIVGGVNSYPDVHVILFLEPQSLSMINCMNLAREQRSLTDWQIIIRTKDSLIEWDQDKIIPIYESRLVVTK
jgi:hypothetical protein